MVTHPQAAVIRAAFERVSGQPLDDFGPQSKIAEMGIDSVALAEIVVQIEEALDIDIPFARWLGVRTVQDVFDMFDETGQILGHRGVIDDVIF